MLSWLLNLIPAYRALLRQVQDLSQEKLLLQDRLDGAEAERAKVWSELQRALQGEREAYQTVINEHWQLRYGVAPYPESPKIPSQMGTPQEGGPIPTHRKFGNGLVVEKTNAFIREFNRRVDEAAKQRS